MSHFSRRDALKTGLVLVGGSSLPLFKSQARAQAGAGAEPHFFLYVSLFFGADPSYLFDARPLKLTAANKMQNYTGKEPELWTGSNGQTALASAATAPLKALKSDFSIINGVMMSTFDGHGQNQNFIFSGSPFGGDSFIPQLNGRDALPLDSLILTLFDPAVSITNSAASLQTNPFALTSLSQLFQGAGGPGGADPTSDFIASRYQAMAQGAGGFSQGTGLMQKGFASSGSLAAKLKATSFQGPTFDPQTGTQTQPPVPVNLQVVGQFFNKGIAKSLVLGMDGNFDVHDPLAASQQPALFATTVNSLVDLIKYLKNTPCDGAPGKSLFDVTTLLVGSEFGRTMRQTQFATVDKTGTDHNPLNNSFLLAGKGVKGGLVIGASDMTDVDATGNLLNVSGAHKALDSDLVKMMGQPFDFTTFAPVPGALPTAFDNTQYLNFGAVANTLYRIFGYSETDAPYRRFSAGGNVLPFLAPLIA